MNFKRFGTAAALAAAGTLVLAGCAANEGNTGGTTDNGDSTASASTLSGTIDASGASSQEAAQQAWVANFQQANPDVTINYDPTGSGTGRENFQSGASPFIGSDRAFNDEEIAAGGFGACATDDIVELPLYISPIAIAFNVEGVDSLNLDAETIARIFKGEISNWNDEAIASLNPDADLPDLAIAPVHRSDESGTTENFTDYLAAVAGDAWGEEASGDWPFEGGEAAQGTSGVVAAIEGGNGTIGYADASQVGDLSTVAIEVGGEWVEYSPEAAAAIVDASPMVEGRGEGDLAIELDRTTQDANAYPIALVSYLIGCQEYEDADTAAIVAAYFEYMASEEGQQAAADAAGSAPITSELRERVMSAIELINA